MTFQPATITRVLTRLFLLQGFREANTDTAKAEPAAELAENGHASPSSDAKPGGEAAEAAAGADGSRAANSSAAGNSSSKRIKLEDGTAAAAGGGGGELALEQELLVCQGQCRSLSSTTRHLTGQLEAERLRVSDVSNRLAEREAEVERLLLRLKEVCTACEMIGVDIVPLNESLQITHCHQADCCSLSCAVNRSGAVS
jgi:hypothetical protein